MLHTHETLPRTSAEAIREFNERYLLAIAAADAPTWADRFVLPVDAPQVTFPISLMGTKFLETREQGSRFRTMREDSFDLSVAEYDAGYEAKAIDLLSNVFAYRNWQKVPDRFLTAQQRHVCQHLAVLLEAGTSMTSPFDDLAFFHASHLSGPGAPTLPTGSNYQSPPADPSDLTSSEMTAMRDVRDENGDKLGAEPDESGCPRRVQAVSDKLNQENLASGSRIHRGEAQAGASPVADANGWYLVDSS